MNLCISKQNKELGLTQSKHLPRDLTVVTQLIQSTALLSPTFVDDYGPAVWVPCLMGDKNPIQVKAFWDSGANFSTISTKLAQQLDEQHASKEVVLETYRSPKSIVSVQCTLNEIQLQTEKHTVLSKFHVEEKLPHDAQLVIGTDIGQKIG